MKVSKENAEHYVWGANCDGWRLVQQPGLSVIHEKMPGNTSEVRHYHERSRQFFFILSGTATMEVNGEAILLNAHEGIEIAPTVPHQMFNHSAEDTEFLVISEPASRGDRVIL